MLPWWIQMPNIISQEEISELEQMVLDNDGFQAYPTRSGDYDGNLCWDMNIEKFNRFDLDSYTMFVHQPANAKVVPHTDNTRWNRNTVLLVPLFWHKDYAECVFTGGDTVTHEVPVLMNTQLEHYVNNNEHDRYNFQICFAEPIVEVYECLTRT